jgi:hypothetical protein
MGKVDEGAILPSIALRTIISEKDTVCENGVRSFFKDP